MDGNLRLSLVLIMRDAEADILRCLASCAEAVDEMVICDTGSRDRSVAQVRKFLRRWQAPGRRGELCRYKWRDDFAAARNYALSRACGDWALLLDSDEYLAEGAAARLRAAVEELRAGGYDAAELVRLNTDREGRALATDRAEDMAVRLARLDPALRYRGEVHEQLLWADGRELRHGVVPRERLLIVHTGYSPEVKRAKDERNMRILLREERQGGSTFLLDHYLAQLHLERREYGAAMRRAEAALRGNRPVHDRFAPWRCLLKAAVELAQAAPGPAAEAQLQEVLERCLRAEPDYPDGYYIRGVLRLNAGGHLDALRDLERAEELAQTFGRLHPGQEDGFAPLRPALAEALAEARGKAEEQDD